MGLFGGFLGWEADDSRLVNSDQHLAAAGIAVQIEIRKLQYEHPNTYKITLSNPEETHQLIAISTGGGMIEVIEIDGAGVSMLGDYFETLIYTSDTSRVHQYLRDNCPYDFLEAKAGFVEVKAQAFLENTYIEELRNLEGVTGIKQLEPVLPVMSRKDLSVPFITCNEMLDYNKDRE